MNSDSTPTSSLTLADGTTWVIQGEDETGEVLARTMAAAMQLPSANRPSGLRLIIKNGIAPGSRRPELPLILGEKAESPSQNIFCQVLRVATNIDLADQLMELGLILVSSVEARGGLLLHGALAEKNGQGVILAGPSDVGKTTASRRLPDSWQSLSDDCTLVVQDSEGVYHAHPWPTWSSFLEGNHGQNWNVQNNVPLKAVFMLVQGKQDRVEPLGPGQTACMLNETAEQVWFGLDTDFDKTRRQQLRLRCFNNICELTKKVPSYTLEITQDGPFWEKIEHMLEQLTRS